MWESSRNQILAESCRSPDNQVRRWLEPVNYRQSYASPIIMSTGELIFLITLLSGCSLAVRLPENPSNYLQACQALESLAKD
jgi:hypothetical protein